MEIGWVWECGNVSLSEGRENKGISSLEWSMTSLGILNGILHHLSRNQHAESFTLGDTNVAKRIVEFGSLYLELCMLSR